MDQEIQAFLEVCRQKSISRAAENLFISQSSLSTKIRILERRLGYALFIRGKGSRSVMLTDKGEKFFGLALKYQEILEEMYALGRDTGVEKLRISSMNSLGTHLLTPVYERFMAENPDITLEIQDTDPAHLGLEKGLTDIAFTTSKFESAIVQVRPAFSEPMFFLCAEKSDYKDYVRIGDLNPEHEIYVDWSYEFVHWHSQLFHGRQPKLALSLMNQLQFFLQKEDHWAFVPASVAVGLLAEGGIQKLSTSFVLPPRVINYLCLEKAMESRRVRRFLECLRQVLLEMEQVKFEIFI
mgnify:CR=1 FL=1